MLVAVIGLAAVVCAGNACAYRRAPNSDRDLSNAGLDAATLGMDFVTEAVEASPGNLCFRFRRPRDFILTNAAGADSLVREFAWGPRRLGLDFGAFRNELQEAVPMGSEPLDVDGLFFSFERWSLQDGHAFVLRYDASELLKLTMWLLTPYTEDEGMARQIFESIAGLRKTIELGHCGAGE